MRPGTARHHPPRPLLPIQVRTNSGGTDWIDGEESALDVYLDGQGWVRQPPTRTYVLRSTGQRCTPQRDGQGFIGEQTREVFTRV